MMQNLIHWILKSRMLLLALTLAFVAAGLYVAKSLPIDAVPDITNVQVMVNTKTGSLSPSLIEREVTYPIEMEVTGIPGVKEMRSLSKYGLSQVVVIFEGDVDIYWARNQIFERISGLDLPEGLRAEMAPITTGLGEIVMYTLDFQAGSPFAKVSEQERLIRLREIQERKIRPELRRIEGVADVDTNGGMRKQLHINILPDRMRKYGVSLSELRTALETLGESIGGSYVQSGNDQVVLGLNQDLSKLSELENFPVKRLFNGQTLTLNDLTQLRIESGLRVGAATTLGRETVLGTVLMRSGENSRIVAQKSVALLEQLKLPDGASLKIHYSRSYLVDATVNTVAKSLLEGAILVILVLLLLLGDVRSALIVTTVIPLSMLGAFIGMKFTGVSANLMSLGAIDFGLIVDGAVVMVEFYLLKGADGKRSTWEVIRESYGEVARPILLGIAIIILVYVPILFLSGVEGKMFKPMALTVLFALATSLVLTMLIVPALGSLILRLEVPHSDPLLFRLLDRLYRPSLSLVVKLRHGVLALSLIALALGGWIYISKLGSEFIPRLDEGDLVIGLVRPASQGIDESIRQQVKAEGIIASFAEVESVFSRMGTPDSATDPMSINFADTFVILKKDKTLWPKVESLGRSRSKSELFEAIKSKLEKELPPQDISQTQPIEMRFNEILEGSRADVTLRIYGDDLEKLETSIQKARDLLAPMPGVKDIQFDSLTALTKTPVWEIQAKMDRLLALGVSARDLKESFAAAMAGETIGGFFESQRRIPILLHLDETLRNREEEILNLPVPLLYGGSVPLKELADLKKVERVTTIARSYGERYSAVSLFLNTDDPQAFVRNAEQNLLEAKILPEGYRMNWGGRFKNLMEAKERLTLVLPFILLLILILLVWHFRSLREAVLVILAVPFALLGGIISLWLRDLPLSLPAYIGFIALGGIAILNGLVMLTQIQLNLESGMPVKEAVITGAFSRLRPVMMTALVAALGFVPMALSTSVGAEVQRPLATVVIGGIISSTALTLILLPLGGILLLRPRRKSKIEESTKAEDLSFTDSREEFLPT